MKRFINQVRTVNVTPFTEGANTYQNKFKILADLNPVLVNNELVIGQYTSGETTKKYPFVVKVIGGNKKLFALSHDDISYDFIKLETARINALYQNFINSITADSDNANYLVELDVPGA